MKEPRTTAARVASVYAVVAVGWILFSDWVTALLAPPASTYAQSAKGLAFVAVTAIAIYLLVQRLGEQAAREAERSETVERMLGQVVTTVPVGVLLTSDDGTVTFANAAAETMLGVPAVDILGRGVDTLWGSSRAEGTSVLGELMRTGYVEGVEVGEGESVRSVLARAAEIDPSLPASGWVIAIADITEAHSAQAAAERLTGGYRFLAEALIAISDAEDEATLLRAVAQAGVESGRYVGAWAVHHDPLTGTFQDVAATGVGERTLETAGMMRERAEADPSAIPFAPGQIMVSNDIVRDPANVWHPGAIEEGYGAGATLGVAVGDRFVGGVTFFAAETGAFDAREVEILTSLEEVLSSAAARLPA